jgi:hypothetical protein
MTLNNSLGNYCNGIIPEWCFPYQVNDDVPCDDACSDWMDYLMPLAAYGKFSSDRDTMKTMIMESGPIVATMLFTYAIHGSNNLQEWGWEHHDPQDYYAYPGPTQIANHQVVIVGWKDDLSISNGGYWIVKNSLGEEWGYDGYFNLEYGSLNIDTLECVWVDYDPQDYSNWMPVASPGGPYQGSVNQDIMYDGSASVDHEGTIVSYLWDFGDGTTSPDVSAVHTYSESGIYPVSLTVTDNQDYTQTRSTWAYIDADNHPPLTPTLKGKEVGKNGTTYQYSFTATDPDDDELYYYLNWGDTYWDGGAVGWIGPYPSGQEVTIEKIWEEKGNYTIRVKARDTYDAKSEWGTLVVSMASSLGREHTMFWEKVFERVPLMALILKQVYGEQ